VVWIEGGRLAGSLSHLPSLASQSSHALLSPLSTHATVDVEKQGDSVIVTDDTVKAGGAESLAVLDDSLEGCTQRGC
jgi:hypothetical protein